MTDSALINIQSKLIIKKLNGLIMRRWFTCQYFTQRYECDIGGFNLMTKSDFFATFESYDVNGAGVADATEVRASDVAIYAIPCT